MEPTRVLGDGTPGQRAEHPEAANRVVIIGAGPAGLSAAYELVKSGCCPLVIEKRDRPGGISRTENYQGFYFDMGGHRFFTKNAEVDRMWHEVLGDGLLRRPRLSRIYYGRRFFYYPLKPLNAMLGLGPIEGARIVLSYVRSQLSPYPDEQTFEQWVSNRFGRRLFEIFFKTYTEKVWGISTSELRAEWAAQRIQDLSLKSAVVSMFFKPKQAIKSLIDEFDYPAHGPGMLWSAVADRVKASGGDVLFESAVTRVHREGNRVLGVTITRDGREEYVQAEALISSMPLRDFVERLDPPEPAILQAARQLKYRDFLTVCLVIDRPNLFPDTWIYVHDASVKVGRIQNFKSWSPAMVPNSSQSSLGLEYFCNEGDELWNMPDEELVELGKREIAEMGLARREEVCAGTVFRVEKAYPVYDATYRECLAQVRTFVDELENCQIIGRNGLHRYDNQDHAGYTGMLAARNLACGERNDVWNVNTEQEYHEEVRSPTEQPDATRTVEEALSSVFRRLDPVALGQASGIMGGLLLFLATLFLVIKDGPMVGANLSLLSQVFPYYDVTAAGSLLGLIYGALTGFGVGWVYACLRNITVMLTLAAMDRRVRLEMLWKGLD